MSNLSLTIKKKYFDEILAGIKTEEYRIIKPYWINRIEGKNYTHIIFHNGYNKDSPRLEAEYLGYEIKKITHEFFGSNAVTVFVLKLGKIKRL